MYNTIERESKKMRDRKQIEKELNIELKENSNVFRVLQYKDDKTRKIHSEIRFLEGKKFKTKGFVVFKTETGAHNGELYGSHVKKLLEKFFIHVKGKMIILMGEVESAEKDFKMVVRNNMKHIV